MSITMSWRYCWEWPRAYVLHWATHLLEPALTGTLIHSQENNQDLVYEPKLYSLHIGNSSTKQRGSNTMELASVGDMLINTQKKTWEMMVNPGVHGYTKTPNQRKILRKSQNYNLLKTN